MLDIRSIGHINVVVPNIDEAEKYYLEIFSAKLVASLPHFKNEGMTKNMGLANADLSEKIIKFSHCNLVILLIEFHTEAGSKEIPKNNLNDMGGPRHIGLNVENIEASFDFLKSRSDIEILNSSDFRPVTYSPITPDQFHLASQDADQNQQEKQRLAELLSKKKSFYFRDKYGVIWEIEERFYADS